MYKCKMAHHSKKNTVIINGQQLNADEKVLVERGGKFELISASKLKAMLPQATQTSEPKKHKKRDKKKDDKKSRSMEVHTGKSRSQSPKRHYTTTRTSTIDYESIKSPYAMSPEMKTMMKKLAEARDAKRREEEAEEKLAEEEARKMAEKAWKVWLEKKNAEMKDQKSRQASSAQSNREALKQREEAIKAYKSWIHAKQLEIRKERLLTQQLQIEQDEGFYLRARKDCNRAFRSWLHKKSRAIREEREAADKTRRESRAEARRAKRAQDLINSIQQSQQMRYVEYYGYRF